MRRFETRYYKQLHDWAVNRPLAHGYAVTTENALCAAVRRVFTYRYGGHSICVIYDRELEIELLVVQMGPNGLEATFTQAVRALANTQLRRVK